MLCPYEGNLAVKGVFFKKSNQRLNKTVKQRENVPRLRVDGFDPCYSSLEDKQSNSMGKEFQ